MPPMRYQEAYAWFVLFATLDVVLTWHILERHRGREVNPVADLLITVWGFPGAVAFKYALVLFVIVACEIVGRRRDASGRRLVWRAVVVAATPVAWSLVLLGAAAARRNGLL